MTGPRPGLPVGRRHRSVALTTRGVVRLVPWAFGAVLALTVATSGGGVSVKSVAVAALALVAVWMVASPRIELTLAILLVYLGLFDGYLKLKTGSRTATLGRDVLLYAIIAGLLIRAVLARTPLRLPPFGGWIVALVLLGIVEVLNPGTGGIGRGLAAVRPHIEFVPLFFLGWMIMRTPGRLRGYLWLLLFVAAVNGVVGLIQFNLTPAQFARWGPGYAADILGGNGIAGRVFTDASGVGHVRPFGLGADAGDGGILGALAVGAPVALLLTRGRWSRLITAGILVPLTAGIVLAIVTSQTRIAVGGAAVALVAFVLLCVTRFEGRRFVALVGGLAIAATIGVLVVNQVEAGSPTSSGSQFRYSTIAPKRALSTAISYKGASFAQFPTLAVHYPFGAGLGSVGPASGFGRGTGQSDPLDGEIEPDFLVVELGIAGVIIFYGLQLSLMGGCFVAIRRIRDVELRMLLAAIAVPIYALFVMGISGPVSSGAPSSPIYWFSAGTMAWWITSVHRARNTLPANGTAA